MPASEIGPATKILVGINLLLGLLLISNDYWIQAIVGGGLVPGRFWMSDIVADSYLLPVWLTPITSAFLHGSVAHIVLNMVMLVLMGKWLEGLYGKYLFVLVYFASMISADIFEVAASYFQIWGGSASTAPVIGASGAISGLFATYAMILPRKEPTPLGIIPAYYAHQLKLLLGWSALNMMMGFAFPLLGVQVAIWSHIGGFVVGLLIAVPLLRWKLGNK